MMNQRSGQAELYGVQMLRAVAALAVVVHHTLEQSNGAAHRFSPDRLTTSGASGVDIFFVLSGFIMLHVSFRGTDAPPTPGAFLLRRATRIYPFYWLCCLGVLTISAMGFLATHHFPASRVVAALLLLPGDTILGVSWTLVYEVYFYLLFAATLKARSATVSVFATTAAILALQVAGALLPASDTASFLTSPLPLEFCFGLFLAYAYAAWSRRNRSWPVPPVAALALMGLMAAVPLFVMHDGTAGLPALPRVFAWGIPATLVVASALSIGAPRGAIARFLVLLGDASYALYLTHVFVMMGYGRVMKIEAFRHLPQQGFVVLIVLLCLAVGLVAHLVLEKPLLAVVRHVTRHQPRRAAPIDQPA